MELVSIDNGFGFARKRKKWLFLLAAFGLTGYGAYRVYNSPSIARKRDRISKLLGAVISLAETTSESAETVGIVSREIKEFLKSDSDGIPNSLKQISKITRSNDFSDSLITLAQGLTIGIVRGYAKTRADGDENSTSSGFMDQVLDRLFTTAGSGFASVIVGSFARNLVLGLYSDQMSGRESNSCDSRNHKSQLDPSVSGWVDVVCDDKCKELIGDCIQTFVSTAVAVYLDKTMDINTYDEFFSGLTNPRHEAKVKEMLVTVCNGAIQTLVKTSHHVLSSSNPDDNHCDSSCLAVVESQSPTGSGSFSEEASRMESKERRSGEEEERGWVNKVSSTLAVPSNRRFMLDLTGRITFETVRSFMEFLLEKLYHCVRRCIHFVHESAAARSLEVVRYASAKFSVITTVCLSLCLHVTSSVWLLTPA